MQHVLGDDGQPAAVLALAGRRVESFEGRLPDVFPLGLRRRTCKNTGLLAGSITAVAIEILLLALVGNDTVEGVPDFLSGVYITAVAVVAAILTFIEMLPGKETAALPGRAHL
ncbi:hypothetical protein [Streptomyces djakartensis]|uniref:hypothetical protein n=1 Tax=Streptomyces djakartensis TaxID=68193 RepID=UPI0034DFE1D9